MMRVGECAAGEGRGEILSFPFLLSLALPLLPLVLPLSGLLFCLVFSPCLGVCLCFARARVIQRFSKKALS